MFLISDPSLWTLVEVCILGIFKWPVYLRILAWGTWVGQSTNHPTLNFGSPHDVGVVAPSPTLDSALIRES